MLRDRKYTNDELVGKFCIYSDSDRPCPAMVVLVVATTAAASRVDVIYVARRTRGPKRNVREALAAELTPIEEFGVAIAEFFEDNGLLVFETVGPSTAVYRSGGIRKWQARDNEIAVAVCSGAMGHVVRAF